MLDVELERRRRPAVVGSAQQERAVAAIEKVGVAGVAPEHLDECAPAIAAFGDVQLRATAFGALQPQARHGQTALGEARGNGCRCRPAVRCTEHDEQRRPDGCTRGRGEEERRYTGTSGHRHHDRKTEQRGVGGASPLPTEPWLSDHRDGRGGREARERGEPRRRDPRTARHRVGEPSGQIDRGFEAEPHRPPHGARQRDQAEPAPALQYGKADRHCGGHGDRDDLREREEQLTNRHGRARRDPTEVGGHAVARVRAERDDDRQQQRGGSPERQPHHVAGVPEIAFARRSGIEDRRARGDDLGT